MWMTSRQSLVVLLLVQALLLGWMGGTLCPNQTEVGHMGATVYFWNTLRFDVFHVNPPLTRIVSGWPILLCSPQYDWDSYSARPQDRAEWALGRAFIAANRPEKTWWCFALVRWALIPLVLAGGYFGYALSREIYGPSAASVFLLLWCFSPLVLAWGATICPDVAAASLGMVALYTLRQWLRQPTWFRAALAGVCLGLLPLTKLTWLLAFAIWPMIWCVWILPYGRRKGEGPAATFPPLRQLLVVLLLGLYTLNLGYLFDGTGRPLGDFTFVSQTLRGPAASSGNRFAGSWLGQVPLPLPAEFVQGLDTQRLDFERGMPSYCGGHWALQGWWYYYLYALAVKMPLGSWCLVLLAVLLTFVGQGYNAAWRDEMLLLLPLGALALVISSQTGISMHMRYLLPALPLLFLWLSKVGRGAALRHRGVVTLSTVALGGMILSSLWSYPHSLSYFHELVGGPRCGASYLLGSNLDWGQDLFALESWCQAHPEAQPLRVAYDGQYALNKTGIQSAGEPLLESGLATEGDPPTKAWPEPGWYALSVNALYAQHPRYRAFLHFRPKVLIGYSIYIYHITSEEIDRLRRSGPGPAEPQESLPKGRERRGANPSGQAAGGGLGPAS